MDSIQLKGDRIEQILNDAPSVEEDTLETKCEKIRGILNSNPHMTDKGFIEDMISLSAEFISRFSGVNIEDYLERLKDVNVVYFGKYTYKGNPIKYLPNGNTIMVNKDKIIKEDVDVKHGLMKAIIAMATTNKTTYYLDTETKKDLVAGSEYLEKPIPNLEQPRERYYYGFGSDERLEALNEGFCDLTARALVGDEGNSGFKQEREIVDFIGRRIGVEPFLSAFFTNDSQMLTNSLLEKCGDSKKLVDLLEQINYNMSTKKVDEEFIPVKLEMQLMQAFGQADLKVSRQPMSYTSQTTGGKIR